MTFDATLGTPKTLSGNTPQQSFTLVAISGTCGCPQVEIVRSSARDRVNQGLQSLFVNVRFLYQQNNTSALSKPLPVITNSSSFIIARGIADVKPEFLLVAAIVFRLKSANIVNEGCNKLKSQTNVLLKPEKIDKGHRVKMKIDYGIWDNTNQLAN